MISKNANQTEKHFEYLLIQYTKNLKRENYMILNDSQFGDLTFDDFSGQQIKLISNNAIGNSVNSVSIQGPINDLPPKYHVWKVINGMTKVTSISMDLNITEIPTQAFTSKKLHSISISVNTMHGNNMTIKSKAFYNADNLFRFQLYHANITKIQSQAFALANNSSQKLEISFGGCQFSDDAFDPKSFDGIQRQVQVIFLFGNVTFIPESAFKPLLQNKENRMSVYDGLFNCLDCRNHWLIKDKKELQFLNPICMHDTKLSFYSDQVKSYLNSHCKH